MMNQNSTIPPWAVERLEQLREVEILLGHIPRNAQWRSDHIEDVLASCVDTESTKPISEQTSEFLFKTIALGLSKEGFAPGTIADVINSMVFYENGPKYCDESEVRGVL